MFILYVPRSPQKDPSEARWAYVGLSPLWCEEGAILSPGWACVRLCRAQARPMWGPGYAQLDSMLAHVAPLLALCWPYVKLMLAKAAKNGAGHAKRSAAQKAP